MLHLMYDHLLIAFLGFIMHWLCTSHMLARRLPALLRPHTWVQRITISLEHRLNKSKRRAQDLMMRGLVVTVLLLALPLTAAWGVTHVLNAKLLPPFWHTMVCMMLVAYSLPLKLNLQAAGSIRKALETKKLQSARHQLYDLSHYDAHKLDADSIARLTLDSLARRWSETVVAPLFWFIVAGWYGLWGYQAVNAASFLMVRNAPLRVFGFTLDILERCLLFIPAHIAATLLAMGALLTPGTTLSGASNALRQVRGLREALYHLPAAVLGGALGILLGGPRSLRSHYLEFPWLGHGEKAVTADIRRGQWLILCASVVLAAFLGIACALPRLTIVMETLARF